MQAVKSVNMTQHFKSVVEGFSDTLPIIAKCSGRNEKGQNILETISNDLRINTQGAHNAVADVVMLEQVLFKLKISNKKL